MVGRLIAGVSTGDDTGYGAFLISQMGGQVVKKEGSTTVWRGQFGVSADFGGRANQFGLAEARDGACRGQWRLVEVGWLN